MSQQNFFGLRGTLSLALLGVVLGCGSSPPKPQNALQAEMVGAPSGRRGACQLGLQNKKAICGTGRPCPGMPTLHWPARPAEGRAAH